MDYAGLVTLPHIHDSLVDPVLRPVSTNYSVRRRLVTFLGYLKFDVQRVQLSGRKVAQTSSTTEQREAKPAPEARGHIAPKLCRGRSRHFLQCHTVYLNS